VTPPQALRAAVLLAVWPALAGAQQVTIGPEFGVSEYREAAAGLRFRGNGPGAAARIRFHRLTAEGSYVSLNMDPTDDSQATESFRATLVDAWLRWEALSYLGVEVGLLHRSTDSEFAAQSVGALRIGARTQAPLGPGADVWLRGDYLAAAQFSGGGSAPVALEIGLGLDVRWSQRVRGSALYSFQRFDRTTNPAGGAEVSVPIVQSLARIGLAVGF
jgi:hypothetical protein